MSDYFELLLIFIAAVNPPAVVLALERRDAKAAALGGAVAAVLVLLAALLGEDLLAALDIEPESFRIAAAIVMAISGCAALLRLRTAAPAPAGWQAGIFPLAVPLLGGPAVLVAAVSYGVDEGAGPALAAALPVIAVAAALTLYPVARWRPAADGLARILGALLVVVAAGLAIDGVRAV
jgi:multiple antibiotic resistance protein